MFPTDRCEHIVNFDPVELDCRKTGIYMVNFEPVDCIKTGTYMVYFNLWIVLKPEHIWSVFNL